MVLNSGGYSCHLVHIEHPKIMMLKHALSQPFPISPLLLNVLPYHHEDFIFFLITSIFITVLSSFPILSTSNTLLFLIKLLKKTELEQPEILLQNAARRIQKA